MHPSFQNLEFSKSERRNHPLPLRLTPNSTHQTKRHRATLSFAVMCSDMECTPQLYKPAQSERCPRCWNSSVGEDNQSFFIS